MQRQHWPRPTVPVPDTPGRARVRLLPPRSGLRAARRALRSHARRSRRRGRRGRFEAAGGNGKEADEDEDRARSGVVEEESATANPLGLFRLGFVTPSVPASCQIARLSRQEESTYASSPLHVCISHNACGYVSETAPVLLKLLQPYYLGLTDLMTGAVKKSCLWQAFDVHTARNKHICGPITSSVIRPCADSTKKAEFGV